MSSSVVQVVNNIYALQNQSNLQDRMLFKTMGKDTPFDGGTDDYIYIEGNLTPADGITVIRHKNNGGSFISLNGPTNNNDEKIKAWAYAQSFSVTSATRNSNDVITTASIVWPNGATGTFTTDTINTTYNAIDAWHATHILNGTTKTVTQTAVTRNSNGAVTAQPVITIS
jgi:hypothetical protein